MNKIPTRLRTYYVFENENIVDKHRQKLTYNSAKIKYHNFLDIIATKYFSDFHTKRKLTMH